jgi:hypothetical protein
MTTSRKTNQPAPAADTSSKAGASKSKPADLQPAATGANRGSPAASVMKQFQKTKSESTGRS